MVWAWAFVGVRIGQDRIASKQASSRNRVDLLCRFWKECVSIHKVFIIQAKVGGLKRLQKFLGIFLAVIVVSGTVRVVRIYG